MRPAPLALALVLTLPATLDGQDVTCPVGRVPVEGRVLDLLTLQPVPGATVSAFTTEGGLAGSVPSDEDGEYVLCAVSGVQALHMKAFAGDADGAEVEVRPGADGARRDLYLRVTRAGTVRGAVVDRATGEPVEGLVLAMEGIRRTALTDADGRFEIPNVPAGEHEVVLRHVAYGERVDSLVIASGEEVDVRVEVAPQAVALDPIVVEARRSPSDAARSGVRFDGLGRDEIDLLLPRTRSFPALLQNAIVPGLTVRETSVTGGPPALCVETGRRRGRNRIGDIGCYMVEVYIDDVRVPSPETRLPGLDPNRVDSLRIVPPLWALGRYGGPRVHNGVLLIYTRR